MQFYIEPNRIGNMMSYMPIVSQNPSTKNNSPILRWVKKFPTKFRLVASFKQNRERTFRSPLALGWQILFQATMINLRLINIPTSNEIVRHTFKFLKKRWRPRINSYNVSKHKVDNRLNKHCFTRYWERGAFQVRNFEMILSARGCKYPALILPLKMGAPR